VGFIYAISAKIIPMNMKIFKYYNPSKNANFRLLQRHNMTKTRNKIPAKIGDFIVHQNSSQKYVGIELECWVMAQDPNKESETHQKPGYILDC
jgi:hypothetical protein